MTLTVTSMNASHIGQVRMGDRVTFFTRGHERSITGQCIRLEFGEYQGDYANVVLDSNGARYTFGTGGHLGNTWTTESGSGEWFKA